ncbi:MAG: efflux RND transporter periplasmic adaptor subunit [FCB group bacterium]|jgi:RND family efflux transporter MFP subunit
MKKVIIIGSALALLFIALTIARLISKASQEKVKTGNTFITVDCENVVVGKIDGIMNYTGTVEGIHEATVISQTAGVVVKVNTQIGKRCSAGEILAVVQNAQQQAGLEQAKAQVLAAESNLDKAKNDLARYEKLYKDNVATKDNLEMSQLNVKGAEAQLKSAQAGLKMAEKLLQDTYIKATINGYISTKDCDIGATVAPGTKIAHIVDISKFKIRIMVGENDAVKLHNGKTVDVLIDALPDKTFEGTISSIGFSTENGLRSYPVEVTIDNKTKDQIKSGMFARCVINAETKDNAMLVPERAVIMNNDGTTSVFVLQNGKAYLKNVKVGIKNGGKYEIVSGLSPDMKVVTGGKERLNDGLQAKESYR